MSKAVMYAIKPRYCDLIIKRLKTSEVRKREPKLPLPYKCYIYKTKNGGVIGEYTCYATIQNHRDLRKDGLPKWKEVLTAEDVFRSCLSFKEYEAYAPNDRDLFASCISELKIYEKPKKLSEFVNYDRCPYGGLIDCKKCKEHHCLTRPPQSWCYVEELK